MTERTANYGLPYLMASQAQKEVTHNEALNLLDLLASPRLLSRALSAPPAAPGEGEAWLVGPAASGVWSGREGRIALWYGGWSFLEPRAGLRVWVADEAAALLFDGAAWLPAGEPLPGLDSKPIAQPAAYAGTPPGDGLLSGLMVAAGATVAHNLQQAAPANGYFLRSESGLQICWANLTLSYNSGSNVNFIWNYPAPFIAIPAVVHTPGGVSGAAPSTGSLGYHSVFNISAGQADLRQNRVVGLTDFQPGDTIPTYAVAIGLWKELT